jgi:hypothetical protein
LKVVEGDSKDEVTVAAVVVLDILRKENGGQKTKRANEGVVARKTKD